MLVIDASAAAELVLRRAPASLIERRIREHSGNLHAPHLIDVELLSVLRRLVSSGSATASRARDALDDFQDLRIERYPHEPLLTRAWALRENFSAYDAMYVALAEAISQGGAPLLTADERLGRAVQRHSDVEVTLAAS